MRTPSDVEGFDLEGSSVMCGVGVGVIAIAMGVLAIDERCMIRRMCCQSGRRSSFSCQL
jgi:hypothetical protein